MRFQSALVGQYLAEGMTDDLSPHGLTDAVSETEN